MTRSRCLWAFECGVAVTVSTFTDPLGGLFGNFFTGEFLGSIAN
jgi:hypothetical protein